MSTVPYEVSIAEESTSISSEKKKRSKKEEEIEPDAEKQTRPWVFRMVTNPREKVRRPPKSQNTIFHLGQGAQWPQFAQSIHFLYFMDLKFNNV